MMEDLLICFYEKCVKACDGLKEKIQNSENALEYVI